MIYRIVIILLIAAYLQSCDNEFSLEGIDTQQKLYCSVSRQLKVILH